MKIYAFFRTDGTVSSVRIVPPEHEDGIEEKIKTFNQNCKYEAYVLYDVPEKMEEVITFFLGEKGYKVYSDLDDLDNTLNEVGSDIRSLHDDAFEMSERIERIEKMFEDFKKHFPEDEY